MCHINVFVMSVDLFYKILIYSFAEKRGVEYCEERILLSEAPWTN